MQKMSTKYRKSNPVAHRGAYTLWSSSGPCPRNAWMWQHSQIDKCEYITSAEGKIRTMWSSQQRRAIDIIVEKEHKTHNKCYLW
jgi:hypothetical protein